MREVVRLVFSVSREEHSVPVVREYPLLASTLADDRLRRILVEIAELGAI